MTTNDPLDRNLSLPLGDKIYVVPPPDIPTGRYITKLMSVGMQANNGVEPSEKLVKSLELNDDDETDLYIRILGDTAAQMEADGVSFNDYALAGQTVMVWVVGDKERAEEFWASGGRPGKAKKKPQDRKGKSARQGSTATKSTPAKPKPVKAAPSPTS